MGAPKPVVDFHTAEHGDGRRPHLGDAVLEGSHEALEELGLEGVLAPGQGHRGQRAVERRADPPVVVHRRLDERGDARGAVALEQRHGDGELAQRRQEHVDVLVGEELGLDDVEERALRLREPVWNSNLQPDFNVRVCDGFDASSSAVL